MQALFSSSISLKVSLSKSMFLQTFLFVRFLFASISFKKYTSLQALLSASISFCKYSFMQVYLAPSLNYFCKHLFLQTYLSSSISFCELSFRQASFLQVSLSSRLQHVFFLQRFLSTKHLFLQVFLHTSLAVNFSYTNPFPWLQIFQGESHCRRMYFLNSFTSF